MPRRPAFLANAPSLPADEPQYDTYRVVTDSTGAYSFQVPSDWDQQLSESGSTMVASDFANFLGSELEPGLFSVGSPVLGGWDADLFIDLINAESERASNPCEEVSRRNFVNAGLDGRVQVQSCLGGDIVRVNLAVANAAREHLVHISFKLVDERDYEVAGRVVDTFFLMDPSLLPGLE